MTLHPAPSGLVLVPNRGIQQLVLASYFQGPGGQELKARAAPPVEVLSIWAAKQLQRGLLVAGHACRVQPSRLRLRRLWERAIEATDQQGLLPSDIQSLAREAMEADRLCEHWLIPAGLLPGRSWNDEGFCRWRERVHANLDAHGWLDASGALRELASLLESGDPWPVTLPGQLGLRGFVERTPLERRLLSALESRGVALVETEQGLPQAADLMTECYPDRDSEIRAAADWAREQLALGAGRIAIAVNDFPAVRARLERAFQHTFHPDHALASSVPEVPVYHVHGGSELVREPLVRAAFDLLELSISGMTRAQPFALLSRWLLSPAWQGADTEAAGRARLELALRRSERFRPTLAFVADLARKFDCPGLLELAGRIPGAEVAPTPAGRFYAWLSHWGWPGPMAAGERARQAVDHVRKALEELEFSGPASDDVAFKDLQQLCRERQMRSAGGVLSPIQVLPVEDLVGQRFDQTRVINLHGDNWPAPVRLNRLLPFSVNGHLPRSDMQRQYQHFDALQRSVLASAPRVRFSRAEQVDGVQTSVSPLLGALGIEEGDGRVAAGGVPGAAQAGLAWSVWPGAGDSTEVAGRDALNTVERHTGPPLDAGITSLRGVVGVLNLQSACPWAAFLVHRLDAQFAEPPAPFADAAYTGSLVHRALYRLYRPHLGSVRAPARSEVPEAVNHALNSAEVQARLAPAAIEAERRRIEALLQEWLEAEQSLYLGQPHLLEQSREADLAGFSFEVRLDRLDLLKSGSLVLDYKTGTLPRTSWGDERPGELQLPLYAVLAKADPDPPMGIGLLSLRGGDMKHVIWTGASELGGRSVKLAGKAKEIPFADWDATLAAWESTLAGLLNEYRNGVSEFRVYRPDALRWTGLELLLRQATNQDTEGFGELSNEA